MELENGNSQIVIDEIISFPSDSESVFGKGSKKIRLSAQCLKGMPHIFRVHFI